jgi:hypothetical protein
MAILAACAAEREIPKRAEHFADAAKIARGYGKG